MSGSSRERSVVHVLWSGEVGGTTRAVYQLVAEQARHGGFRPATLFAQDRGPYVERFREVAPVLVAGLRSGRDVAGIGRVSRLLRGFEVHHFHGTEPVLFVASALVSGATRVFTERGGTYGPEERKPVREAIAGALARRAFHGFSGNTAHAAAEGSRRFRLPRDAYRVTYNGLDPDLLAPSRTRDEARAALGLGPDDLAVGTSAYLKRWKRIDLLLAAVAAAGPPWRAVVLGDGPDRRRLEDVAARLGLGDRVRFVGMTASVPDHLVALDAFALPSTGLESFGNALVEAMALGIPSIAMADSPGLAEHIENGRTGFVAAGAAGLARILGELAGPDRRAAVGRAGAERVRARYTLSAMREAYEDLYRGALARRAR